MTGEKQNMVGRLKVGLATITAMQIRFQVRNALKRINQTL